MLAVKMIATGSKFLGRSCNECLAFMWTKEGTVDSLDRKRGGYASIKACYDAGTEPRRRPLGVLTPCHECPKVPDDAPEKSVVHAVEITERSFKAIEFHDECQAVGDWPRDSNGQVDAIVRRNARIINRVREAVARKDQVTQMSAMLGIFSAGR